MDFVFLVPRPEPPTEFDENSALASIEERLKKCRRRPGINDISTLKYVDQRIEIYLMLTYKSGPEKRIERKCMHEMLC